MTQTRSFTKRIEWETTLYESPELLLLLLDSASGDVNEYNINTLSNTLTSLSIPTANSAINNDNKLFYVVENATTLNLFDSITKLELGSITISPALPVASPSAGAYNYDDGLLYYYYTDVGVPTFISVNPVTGVSGTPLTQPSFATPQSSGLGIDRSGTFYWPQSTDIGGGQWRLEIFTWTTSSTTPVTLFNQIFANPRQLHQGTTWHIDNKLYFTNATNLTLWSYDISTNEVDLFIDDITRANSAAGYSFIDDNICFRRNYKLELDGTVSFEDTDFDNNPYIAMTSAVCVPSEMPTRIITNDYIMNPTDVLNFPANTLRSIKINNISGNTDINGTLLPATMVMEIEDIDSTTNNLSTNYVITNSTGQTYVCTTEYA